MVAMVAVVLVAVTGEWWHGRWDAMSVVRMTARVAVAVVLMTVGAMVDCSPGAVAVAMTGCPLLPWCLGLSSGGASA